MARETRSAARGGRFTIRGGIIGCLFAAQIGCAGPADTTTIGAGEPIPASLEPLEPIVLPGCTLDVTDPLVVIESDEALARHLRCPPGATPGFDFSQRRIVVLTLLPDADVLGFERRGDDAVLVHTREDVSPRGARTEIVSRSYTIPAGGTVEHVRHQVGGGQDLPCCIPKEPGREAPTPTLAAACELAALRSGGSTNDQVLGLGETSWVLWRQGSELRARQTPTPALASPGWKVARLASEARTDVLAVHEGVLVQYMMPVDNVDFFHLTWRALSAEGVMAAAETGSSKISVLLARAGGVALVDLPSGGASEPRPVGWLPTAAESVGLWPGPESTTSGIWAVTGGELLLGDAEALRARVTLGPRTVGAAVATPSGPAILTRLGGELRLVAQGERGAFVDLPIASEARPGGDQAALQCDRLGAAALTTREGALLMALRCGQGVTLVRVAPDLSSASALSVEGHELSTRELPFDGARGGEGEVLVDADYTHVHVVERAGARLRIHVVEAAAIERRGAALPLAPVELRPAAEAGQAVAEATAAPPEAPPQPACPDGQTPCGRGCFDTRTDWQNCGACGEVCVSGACSRGVCERPCYSNAECNPRPTKTGGPDTASAMTHVCFTDTPSGVRRTHSCAQGRPADSCGSCSADERCVEAPDGSACCERAPCRRQRDCVEPRSKCLAPEGGGPRRCLRGGYCSLPAFVP